MVHPSMAPPFAERVVAWQKVHGRHDLPWQNTRDPYRIWLSEIMLQQTQVTTVIPYYLRFLDCFPDVIALADADLGRVLELWSGLGYYRRAHLLHGAAREVRDRYAGLFPTAPEILASLPGVGRSTAAAIAAFSTGARTPILEGNVKRVLARHAGIEGFPAETRTAAALWRCAEGRLPGSATETVTGNATDTAMAIYTQALMDLGATVCVRSSPLCERCPVASDCSARLQNRVDELPAPRPRRALPQKQCTVLLIERDGCVLLERRPATGIWSGLWSLPETELGADVASFCRTRYGAEIEVVAPLEPIEHGFTHFRLTLFPQRCAAMDWPSAFRETDAQPQLRWLPVGEAATAALPAPIKKLLVAWSVAGTTACRLGLREKDRTA
jgi:A/G-specific adenine glycosylase